MGRSRLVTALVAVLVLGGAVACGAGGPGPRSPEREVVTVPRITEGTSYDDAVARLEARGLQAGEVDSPGPFYVVGTRPAAGTRVAAGSTVELLVGDG